MSPEYTNQMTVGLLLLSLFSVVTIGMLLTFVFARHLERKRMSADKAAFESAAVNEAPAFSLGLPPFENPSRWLAIRSSNPLAVQSALGLHNTKPCSWLEGLSQLTEHTLFISPPIEGWLLVVGPGLPDPSEDIDECYRFILKLSRELGHVQFFSVNRAVNHHAWARVEGERVVRAYAWAEETLWNQGKLSSAEIDLELKCFGYGENPELFSGNSHHSNAEKVTFLAARWSLDPTCIDERRLSSAKGIAGDLTHFRQH
ncbi:MAG: hypothetical protein L0387_15995 [Acidobacteria bacterium]|nr:hypothetical protein [Acidobacteriota bacterium]